MHDWRVAVVEVLEAEGCVSDLYNIRGLGLDGEPEGEKTYDAKDAFLHACDISILFQVCHLVIYSQHA